VQMKRAEFAFLAAEIIPAAAAPVEIDGIS
jgi:hypothetical protein